MKKLAILLSMFLFIVSCKKELIEKEPNVIIIKEIRIDKFNVNDVDPLDNLPELYFTIENNNKTLETTAYKNINTDNIFFMNVSIYNINEIVTLTFYDFDNFDEDDYLGYIDFQLNTKEPIEKIKGNFFELTIRKEFAYR